jgi:predicted DCC family thiol-disulfide oxidoreductase YuxK
LIYDGDCGFCINSAHWIVARWPEKDRPLALPWQSLSPAALAETTLTQADFHSAAWFLEGTRRERGARAVGRALTKASGGWRILGWVILVPPLSWAAALGYRVVAHYRYRLPGGTATCKV